jgi:hypothetical protein
MNLYQKIVKIMGEVKSLKKDGKVDFGNTKYKFLSEAKTTSTLREKFVENNIMVYPIKAEETTSGKITHGHYIFRMVNADNPEEFIDIHSTGQGHDSADKGSGKAQSYAFKYALWRTFSIPSNDDPDQISSAEHLEEERKAEELKKKPIDKTKLETLKLMLEKTETDIAEFCKFFKVETLPEMTNEKWMKGMDMLRRKQEK